MITTISNENKSPTFPKQNTTTTKKITEQSLDLSMGVPDTSEGKKPQNVEEKPLERPPSISPGSILSMIGQ
jgi:hypothetical protein